VVPPRVSDPKKSENRVLCWEGYGHHLLELYKGVLYVDFLTERHTTNTEYYCALLKGLVKTAIRNKRERAQTSVLFLQDNACPNVAACTMDTIQKLKWNTLPHPPCSPDLAPSDYHLFGPLI